MSAPIFIVDSSPAVRRMVEQISTPEGFEVQGFQDGPAALEAARRTNPALIIADYHLDHMTFSGFCREIHKLEHLSETRLVSLINPADHPDDNHLRSLGVSACLNKPLQADELLAVIQQSLHHSKGTANGANLKRQSWPPATVLTDADGNSNVPDPLVHVSDRQGGQTVTEHGPPQPSDPGTRSIADPQEAVKGFFDQLLQSAVKEMESRLVVTLPRMVEEMFSQQVHSLVRHEVQTRFNDMLSTGRMAALIQPLVLQELPSLVGKELAQNEPLLGRAASDAVGVLIKEKLDQRVTDQARALIREQVTEQLRAQTGLMQQVMQEEARSSVVQYLTSHLEQLVKTVAHEAVDQSVQHVVPALAEQHIKAELKRLTDPD
ncbi:MAG: response regulator [Nitrospira sp.]|nr:response regulator [Nitrospira sp.]MCP9441026.1 response regulator [Nitrospira sp.]